MSVHMVIIASERTRTDLVKRFGKKTSTSSNMEINKEKAVTADDDDHDDNVDNEDDLICKAQFLLWMRAQRAARERLQTNQRSTRQDTRVFSKQMRS